jgi:hypothetical protein
MVWPRGVTIVLGVRGDDVGVAYEDSVHDAPRESPGVPLHAARQMLLGARDRVERTPVRGDPARIAAISAWLDVLRWKVAASGTLVDLALSVAPDAPVARVHLQETLDHALWASEHELHFARPGDPRDALVRGAITGVDRFQRILGLRVRSAKLDDGGDVHLVCGPFAAGVLRAIAGLTATPAPEAVPAHELEVTREAPPRGPKFRPSRLIARHASGVTLSVTGYPDHALEVLRVLVADQLICASRK